MCEKDYSTLLSLGYCKPILSKYLERLKGKDTIKYFLGTTEIFK